MLEIVSCHKKVISSWHKAHSSVGDLVTGTENKIKHTSLIFQARSSTFSMVVLLSSTHIYTQIYEEQLQANTKLSIIQPFLNLEAQNFEL